MARSPSAALQSAFPQLSFAYKTHGEFASACPFCGQAAHDGFLVWEQGNYWCRKCGARGWWNRIDGTADERQSKIQRRKAQQAKAQAAHEPYGLDVAAYYHGMLMERPEVMQWLEDHYSIARTVMVTAQLGYDVLPRSYDRGNQRLLVPVRTDDGTKIQGFKGRLIAETVQPIRKVPYDPKRHKKQHPDAHGLVVPERYLSSAGLRSALYGKETITAGQPLIHVGEGELKALAVQSLEYAATTSVTGASTFDDTWAVYIAHVGPSCVYLLYDNDTAGEVGAHKALESLQRLAPQIPVFIVSWPKGRPDGHDISDELRGHSDKRLVLDRLLATTKIAQAVQHGKAEQRHATQTKGRRKVVRVAVSNAPQPSTGLSLEAIRDGMRQAIVDYLANFDPDAPTALLLAPWPGSGKTTELIGMLERLDVRVFYAAPRRDMWDTVLDASHEASLYAGNVAEQSRSSEWFNLRSRSAEDRYGPRNCWYPEAVEKAYMQRRDVFDLICTGPACGLWGDCHYSQQLVEAKEAPLVFARHTHILHSDLPASKDVIVLDENMLRAFLEQQAVTLQDLALDPAATAGAQNLAKLFAIILATGEVTEPLYGPALLPLLHAQSQELYGYGLAELLATIDRTDKAVFGEPEIVPSKVEMLGLKWLPDVYTILQYEVERWQQGQTTWNSRLVVDKKELIYSIINRARVGNKPVILSDATGNAALYSMLLERPVTLYKPTPHQRAEIWQLTTRQNGIGQLQTGSAAWQELLSMIRLFAMQKPKTLIIAYKSVIERIKTLQDTGTLELPASVEFAHYGALSGSNAWKELDQVILAGSYMPPRDALLRKAYALWHTDPEPIVTTWHEEQRPYQVIGELASYPISTFADPRAALVLEQEREAEMVQAFERIRTLLGNQHKRVVLLTNIPLPGITVTRLFDVYDDDVLGRPDTLKAAEMRAFITAHVQQPGDAISLAAIEAHFSAKGWSRPTIFKWRTAIIEELGLVVAAMRLSDAPRGRPPQTALKP